MSERAIFKCGTSPVPVGVGEFAIANLSLPFVPGSVVVSLRQPSVAAPIVSAYLTGEPTADVFNVALSAPVLSEQTNIYEYHWQQLFRHPWQELR